MRLARRIALLIAFSVLLLLALPTHAQTTTLGLNAGDFALLQAAFAATISAQQGQYRFAVQLDGDGLRTFVGGFKLSGSGAFDGSGKTAKQALDVDGAVRLGSTYTTAIAFQARLIDDQLYLKAGGDLIGWQVVPFDRASLTPGGGFIAEDPAAAPIDLLYLYEPDSYFMVDGLRLIPAGILGFDAPSFITATREPNADGMARFRLTFDLPKLVTSKAFVALLHEVNTTAGTLWAMKSLDWFTDNSRGLGAILAQATFTADVAVDPQAKTIHQIVIDLNAPMDPAAMSMTDGPFTVTLHADITLEGIGQPPTIETPGSASAVESLALPLNPDKPALDAEAKQQVMVYLAHMTDNGSSSFPVELKAGDSITLTAESLAEDYEPDVSLLDADSATVVAADPDFVSTDIGLSPLYTQIPDFKVTKDGIYQVHVADPDGAAGTAWVAVAVRR